MRFVVGLLLLASCLPHRFLDAAEDAALTPPVINTSPGREYADSTRIFQGIPGIERAANGRLWALWYAGGPDEPGEGPGNYVVLVASGDDGKTWSGPKLVIDPPGPVRAYDPCLWHSPDGRLWLFWAQSYQWWDGRSGVWAIATENSDDESPRWSAPRRLCNGIMMNKPTVLSTGEWLLPASVWERPADKRTEEGHRHDLGSENAANVQVSRDKGQTWSLLGQAKVPKRVFDEHMLVERRDGSLWMSVRAAYGIGESLSSDRGKTWSAGRESSIPHVNSRFFIRRLNSGKLLVVTHEPPDKKTRSHLIAHLSDDDGKTWRGGLMIDDRKGISYPDGVQAPDGTIYLIYDYSRTGEKQILMATFTEDDVAAGQWSSPKARQRVLVNQATGQRPKAVAPKEADKPKAVEKDENLSRGATELRKSDPNNPLAPIQDVPGLPRVLLIGDSISMGYTLPVRKLLEGKANVHRIPVNGGPTKNGVGNIDKWLGDGKWDVIHFNWGIHDLKYMPDEKRQVEPADYEKNLRTLVAKMKATGAKLIWASTTPIPDGELNPPRRFGNVKEYNDIAARVMSDSGVLVNDLNAHITPEFDRLHTPKDLHYTREGSEFLAKKVAAEIEKALKRP